MIRLYPSTTALTIEQVFHAAANDLLPTTPPLNQDSLYPGFPYCQAVTPSIYQILPQIATFPFFTAVPSKKHTCNSLNKIRRPYYVLYCMIPPGRAARMKNPRTVPLSGRIWYSENKMQSVTPLGRRISREAERNNTNLEEKKGAKDHVSTQNRATKHKR
jgi:hypothetical protein